MDEGFGAGRGTGAGPDGVTSYWRTALSTGEAATHITVNLSSVTDPVSSTGHLLRVQWCKCTSCNGNGTGQIVDATLYLREGTTVIATYTVSNIVTAVITTTETYTLSGGEADSITDYTNLNFRVWHTRVGGGAARNLCLGALELEVPDAPSGGATLLALERSLFRRQLGLLFSRIN